MGIGTEDDASLDTPSCGRCLTPMEVAGSLTRPYWSCVVCGDARLA